MRMKLLSVIAIVMIGNVCFADNGYTCEETLSACDRAYMSQKQLITDQKTQIENYFQKTMLQQRIIADQQANLDNPLHDPVKVAAVAVVVTIGVMLLTGHVK